jgi:hypothetical protein
MQWKMNNNPWNKDCESQKTYTTIVEDPIILTIGLPLVYTTVTDTNEDLLHHILLKLNPLSDSLVWCPGQNKRIAPLSFLHGYRKRRLKD